MNLLGKLTVVVVATIWASNSRADLINFGNVTFDTNTGLEWLDVTETMGKSVLDVLAGPYVADGWLLATLDQFELLAGTYVGIPKGVASNDLIPLLRGGRALALLGCTVSVNSDLCPFQATDPNDPIAFGVLGALDDLNGDASRAGFGDIVLRIFDDDITITWQTFSDFDRIDRRVPQVGAYLVRPVSVPEPGTLALFAIGLLGLGLTRKRSA